MNKVKRFLKTIYVTIVMSVFMLFPSFAGVSNRGVDISAFAKNVLSPISSNVITQMTAQINTSPITNGILFSKSAHRVDIYQNGQIVKSYNAASGMASGDKEREGDCKTPEGTFYIAKKVPNSSYILVLLISYPSIEDAERGFATGLISAAQRASIISSNQRGETPLQNTNLGGEIEFHGCDDVLNDATHGCIILSRPDIIDLYNRAYVGMQVVITA